MFGLIKRLFGGGSAPRRVRPPPMSVEELRQLLLAHERPSVWLTPTEEPRFSKLGGAPDVDGDIDWPKGWGGVPMAFVAQLDLADVRAAGGPDWLPGEGVLYFFTDTSSINPGAGGRVIHGSSPRGGVLAKAPAGAQTFGERPVGLEVHPSYPSTEWLNVAERCYGFDDEDHAALDGLWPGTEGDATDHRCGGYPQEVQSGYFPIHCELWARGEADAIDGLFKDPVARDALNAEAIQHWRLLLQIDNDESVGMTWYDAGRIYYFIREEDARAGDFTKVQFDIQFC